jgi:hypothetical protein
MHIRTLAAVVVSAGAAATLALSASSAMAATTGVKPAPTPSPAPAVHHHHPKPREHVFCFASLLTETDTVSGHQITSQPTGPQAPKPNPTQTIVNGGNQPAGGQGQQVKGPEVIEVVQLVKVCETIGEHGRVSSVTATDESSPFAWEMALGGGQYPAGLPSPVKGALIGS